jgi:hypothetical protein
MLAICETTQQIGSSLSSRYSAFITINNSSCQCFACFMKNKIVLHATHSGAIMLDDHRIITIFLHTCETSTSYLPLSYLHKQQHYIHNYNYGTASVTQRGTSQFTESPIQAGLDASTRK